ncbi:flagellar hook-basal body protein [Limnoglobus roseus]|uniref:Flagellar hook basal-body protein n=1 Tax=Limnoglobus roseus TaxID=2598579 RepID=A0A5C1A539_9BACT|nr:flagellar hook basal-body protein [Limnoglobus roseus]QEL13790.1 flagellar hook basal-body protein [Limnoglobus roseus]
MFRGLYSAASALDAASQAQDITAHNLAHVNTPGYRQRGVAYETFDRVLGRTQDPTGDIVGTRLVQGFSDFRVGPLQQTGNALDLALGEPDRFFVVTNPTTNQPMYTRDGSFHQNPQGQLVSTSGYLLQGEGGAPIKVPQGTSNFNIALDGSITADGAPVGQLRVVRVGNTKELTPVGDTLFSASENAGVQAVPSRVMQGFREGSNVNPAEAMTGMILASRFYDATQRVLRSIAESVQLNTKPS